MDDIFLHNTLSGKKEKFEPIEAGKVTIYSCGPTVYDYAHIGNFRSFLLSDLLTRVLKYAGYNVTKVMNITDVGHLTNDDTADADGEDKITKKAKAEKIDPFAIAKRYEDAFLEDAEILRMEPADKYPRATDHIKEQIVLAQKLIDEGYAYEVNGSVYFRTTKYEKYGQLSKNKLKDLQAGARVEVNSEKENPLDFALWKKADANHLMQWDSPWGKGFPGWHIECSAMSRKIFGDHFDIHTGGEDNIFPHHECEIAQNECSNGGQKSVNYWLHVKHLLVDGKKMSKSAGNFYTIRDLLEKGWKGEEIRFTLLKSHYKTEFSFSEDRLEESRKNIKKIREAYASAEESVQATEGSVCDKTIEYKKMLFDDLNVPSALAIVYEVLEDADKKAVRYFLENNFEPIFAIGLEAEVNSKKQLLLSENIRPLLLQRMEARKIGDWTESDRLRDELLEKFKVEVRDEIDKQDGRILTRWNSIIEEGLGFLYLK